MDTRFPDLAADMGPTVDASAARLDPQEATPTGHCTCRPGRDHDGSEFGPCDYCEALAYAEPATQHTPGPWRLRVNRHTATSGEEWGWVSANTDQNISLPGVQINWQGPQGKANARLIAAAPDLLAALQQLHIKTVIGTDEERHAALAAAWRAIARATAQ